MTNIMLTNLVLGAQLLLTSNGGFRWSDQTNTTEQVIARIEQRVVTNWVTTSIERPVCDRPGCLVIHYDTHHQEGNIQTQTVASVEWKGRTNHVILEQSDPVYSLDLRRSFKKSQFDPLLMP